jgi:hypothetical protein
MLVWLTKSVRSRAACWLVLAYALCVLAPSAALALGDAARAAHCLTGDHHAAAQPPGHDHHAGAGHAHAGDATHEHSSDDNKAKPGEPQCCGLMCLPAIPAAAHDLTPPSLLAATVLFAPANLTGREPERLSRPPDSSLSH